MLPKTVFYANPQHVTILFTDFSDRISRSRRVGYESGDFEIVSTLISGKSFVVFLFAVFLFFYLQSRIQDFISVTDYFWAIVSSIVQQYTWYSHNFLYGCLAWRRLWCKRDPAAEVPTSGERNPGAHSRSRCHPGSLIVGLFSLRGHIKHLLMLC